MQGSASLFDEGRFGPVYRSHDRELDQPVLIRTFAQPLTPAEQGRLVEALTRLCETPLDHASIARPLVTGIEDGRPFLVHTLLAGISLERYLESNGPQPFADVVLRVTQLAAAIDFAAAAGVHHGDLGAKDVIVSPESTGISGFGVVQALHEAGVGDAAAPSRSADVRALAAVAFQLITARPLKTPTDLRDLRVPGANGVRLRDALAAALGERPGAEPATALAFAAALKDAIVEPMPIAEQPRVAPAPEPTPTVPGSARARAPEPARVSDDLPLRLDRESAAAAGAAEPVLALRPEQAHPDPSPLLRDDRPAAAPSPPVRPAHGSTLGISAAHSPAPDAQGGSGWLLVSAALAIGILAGFTGGFIVGQRSDVPIPQFASDLLERGLRSSGQPDAGAAREPTSGTGSAAASGGDAAAAPVEGVADTGANTVQQPEISSRDLEPDAGPPPGASSASAADDPTPAAPPAARTAEPAGPAAAPTPVPAAPPDSSPADPSPAVPGTSRPARVDAAPGIPTNTPGGLQVLSRPEGAQVFLDGAFVGLTPLVIPSIGPGPHDVRLELANHRTWGTMVRVQPGERARVAASLEQ